MAVKKRLRALKDDESQEIKIDCHAVAKNRCELKLEHAVKMLDEVETKISDNCVHGKGRDRSEIKDWERDLSLVREIKQRIDQEFTSCEFYVHSKIECDLKYTDVIDKVHTVMKILNNRDEDHSLDTQTAIYLDSTRQNAVSSKEFLMIDVERKEVIADSEASNSCDIDQGCYGLLKINPNIIVNTGVDDPSSNEIELVAKVDSIHGAMIKPCVTDSRVGKEFSGHSLSVQNKDKSGDTAHQNCEIVTPMGEINVAVELYIQKLGHMENFGPFCEKSGEKWNIPIIFTAEWELNLKAMKFASCEPLIGMFYLIVPNTSGLCRSQWGLWTFIMLFGFYSDNVPTHCELWVPG